MRIETAGLDSLVRDIGRSEDRRGVAAELGGDRGAESTAEEIQEVRNPGVARYVANPAGQIRGGFRVGHVRSYGRVEHLGWPGSGVA